MIAINFVDSLKIFFIQMLHEIFSFFLRMPQLPGFYSVKVLGGKLRGKTLFMPQLEQLAFPLGRYEPHIVRIMESYLKPNMICYDVGAHIGYLSMIMGQLVGKEGKVIVFEANPTNNQAIKANVNANNISNIQIESKAVSDKTGIVRFATFKYSLVGHIETEETPGDAKILELEAVSLDDFVFDQNHAPPNFIKIDVEGAEEAVFKGLTKTMKEFHPIIIAEVRNIYFENIINIVQKYDYSHKVLDGGWDMDKDELTDVVFFPSFVLA